MGEEWVVSYFDIASGFRSVILPSHEAARELESDLFSDGNAGLIQITKAERPEDPEGPQSPGVEDLPALIRVVAFMENLSGPDWQPSIAAIKDTIAQLQTQE